MDAIVARRPRPRHDGATKRGVVATGRTRRRTSRGGGGRVAPWSAARRGAHAATTGILPIRACHSRGPVWCTLVPLASTATVTGMSLTSNS